MKYSCTELLRASMSALLIIGFACGTIPTAHAEVGPPGTSTMHGDAESSDTSPYPGPISGGLKAESKVKFAACPTILADSEGMIWTLCTKIIGRSPVVMLLDPATGDTLASLDIAKGGLLGGVYAYLDDRDRLVLVDGRGQLLKIAKDYRGGVWTVKVADKFNISSLLSEGDSVVSLTPDRKGNIWLATQRGRVGMLKESEKNRENPHLDQISLGAGERIDNSISASGQGVAIATSHALYMLEDKGAPRILWRQPYDRGSARKPGQLSWGTGATPSFFGEGHRYITITDNADDQENLLVYRAEDGREVCRAPIHGGTENSAIAFGNSVIVASTYGYPYPALPKGAGKSLPDSAPFTGGMERFDIDETGCHRVWSQPIASAAVPRLSTADNLIYTIERPQIRKGITGLAFHAIAVDARTGKVLSRQKVADTPAQDTLEMVGTITPDGTWWQGTITGVMRIS